MLNRIQTWIKYSIVAAFLCSSYAHANSGVGPNVLKLPKGPGSLGGVGENVRVNLNMGVMSYGIGIKLPNGRVGQSPSFSLSYNSGGGSGVVGIGWNLVGLDSIERCTAKGLPRYGDTSLDPTLPKDDFMCTGGGGELAYMTNSTGARCYRKRFEGSFLRYCWHRKNDQDQRGYWTVEHGNGTIGYYGARYKVSSSRKVGVKEATEDSASQLKSSLGTFRWMLRSQVDKNGNRVEYKYTNDGAQLYLIEVTWVFDKSGSPLYKMLVDYDESRQDVLSDGKPGFFSRTKRRIVGIRVLMSGKPFRSYKLTYDEKSGLSRLLKVVQYGADAKTVYPVQFDMTYSPATFDNKFVTLKSITGGLGINFLTRQADFVDINGDGLPDVVHTDPSKGNHFFHYNQLKVKDFKLLSQSFSAATPNPQKKSSQLKERSTQMLDFNGDGFTDMVDAKNVKVYINKGNGQWEKQTGSIENFPSPGAHSDRRFFDYNGDKATDVMELNGNTITYYISDRKGKWVKKSNMPGLGATFSKDKMQLIDINGDGLSDAVRIIEGKVLFKLYFGFGRFSKKWQEISVPGLKQSLAEKVRFRDINGDGLADMVAFIADTIQFFRNTNSAGFAAPIKLDKSFFKGISLPGSDPKRVEIRLADINGNGSQDIVWLDDNGKITYLELFATRPNLLTHIYNGIGKRITVQYSSSVWYYIQDRDNPDPKKKVQWTSKLPMPFTVVRSTKTWGEIDPKAPEKGCSNIQDILYHDGYYDGVERRFRGFRHVEAIRLGDLSSKTYCPQSMGTSKQVIYYFVGDGRPEDGDQYYHGKTKKQITMGWVNNKWVTYNENTWEWQECPLAGVPKDSVPTVKFVCLKAKESKHIEGQTDSKKFKVIRSEYEYDGFGHVTMNKMLGIKDKTGDEKYTKSKYHAPKDVHNINERWFISMPLEVGVCQTPNGACATKRYYYDGEDYLGLPFGQIQRGNGMRITAKPGPDAEDVPIMRVKYDAYGNWISAKNPAGHLREVKWDALYNRFPQEEIYHLSGYKLKMSTQWDYRYGVVKESTGTNGHKIRYLHDTFGRLTKVVKPGDSFEKPSTQYIYKLQSPFSTITTLQNSKLGQAADLMRVDCFNGVGQLLQKRKKLSTGKFLVSGWTVYNSLGLPARTYNTFIDESEKCALKPGKSILSIQSHYDPVGRIIKRTNQDGSTTTSVHLPLQTINNDEEDLDPKSPHYQTPYILTKDGLGRLIERVDYREKGKKLTTKFVWNHFNSTGNSVLAEAIDPKGNKKVQKSDWFGRIVEINDPNSGTIKYRFDKAGNLIERIDGRGRSTVMTYDPMRRLLSMQEKGKPDTLIKYQYDRPCEGFKATNLLGNLACMMGPYAKAYSSYDDRGRVIVRRVQILNTNFDFQFTMNNVGYLLSKTYPNGKKVTYRRDVGGRLLGVPGFIKSIDYDQYNRLASVTMENALQAKYSYDSRSRNARIQVGTSGLFDVKYTYDKIGNLTSEKGSLNKKAISQVYQYDHLYQLTRAELSEKNALIEYKYDDLGNMLEKRSSLAKKEANLQYLYDPTRPQIAKQIGESKMIHDKGGYLVQEAKNQFQWDYLGRLLNIKQGSSVKTESWYLHKNRIIKRENNQHNVYVSQDYEIKNGVVQIHIKLGLNRYVTWKLFDSQHLFDDLAPTSGSQKLTAKPDGKITVADAWLYHAGRQKILSITTKKRIPDLDLTDDMLSHQLSQLMEAKKERKQYAFSDRLSSTRLLTDEAGKVISTASYTPYGDLLSENTEIRYGFMSTERDSSGMNYAKHRYLDTKTGRWLSPDPYFERSFSPKQVVHGYWYAKNNPLRYIDGDGLNPKKALKGIKKTNVDQPGKIVGIHKHNNKILTKFLEESGTTVNGKSVVDVVKGITAKKQAQLKRDNIYGSDYMCYDFANDLVAELGLQNTGKPKTYARKDQDALNQKFQTEQKDFAGTIFMLGNGKETGHTFVGIQQIHVNGRYINIVADINGSNTGGLPMFKTLESVIGEQAAASKPALKFSRTSGKELAELTEMMTGTMTMQRTVPQAD